MSATPVQATDEAFALFREYWSANAASLNDGEPPLIQWQGVAYAKQPNLPYVVVSIIDGPLTFQSLTDSEGSRRYQDSAIIVAQVRVKKGVGDALGIQLATIARNAFRGRLPTDSGLYFLKSRIERHTEPDGAPYAQFTATAEMHFGETF